MQESVSVEDLPLSETLLSTFQSKCREHLRRGRRMLRAGGGRRPVQAGEEGYGAWGGDLCRLGRRAKEDGKEACVGCGGGL